MALQAALRNVREICVDRAGGERAAKLEKVPGLVDKILVLLDGIVVKRDPALAMADPQGPEGAENGGTSTIPAGAIASTRDVAAALKAIADYFARFEPSNPALLLVRQAEQLIGKSFVEVMRILVPTHIEQAAIAVGGVLPFQLPIERLSALVPEGASTYDSGMQDDAEAPAADSGDENTAAQDDGESSNHDRGNGADETAQAAGGTSAEGANRAPAARRQLRAASRQDAFALLEQASTYYRAAEPSSPIAVLTERARRLAERDFMGLLQEVLPDTFKPQT
jgi:type VI secretion system protein ImpA